MPHPGPAPSSRADDSEVYRSEVYRACCRAPFTGPDIPPSNGKRNMNHHTPLAVACRVLAVFAVFFGLSCGLSIGPACNAQGADPAPAARDNTAAVTQPYIGAPVIYPAEKVAPRIPVKAYPFSLERVRLLPGPFRTAQDRNGAYVLELDIDRLLHTYRLNAGLPSEATPLGGWKGPQIELRGHFTGHVLSACALLFESTGDDRFRDRASRIVDGLAGCQEALGSGYLSAFPDSFIDLVETGRRVWAPWYTLHKILAGLIDVHARCGNDQALAVARKMACWVRTRTDRLDAAAMQRMLEVEFGGMPEALLNLYAITGEPADLALARRPRKTRGPLELERSRVLLHPQPAQAHPPSLRLAPRCALRRLLRARPLQRHPGNAAPRACRGAHVLHCHAIGPVPPLLPPRPLLRLLLGHRHRDLCQGRRQHLLSRRDRRALRESLHRLADRLDRNGTHRNPADRLPRGGRHLPDVQRPPPEGSRGPRAHPGLGRTGRGHR